jgi:histidyl-tRNA synthetase
MALSKSPYRGTRDFFPASMRQRNYIFQKLCEVSERFSYEPYDGPLLEEVDLYLAKSGEELINEQIYSFTDRGDRKVAIRPEMTPTVARMVAQIHREVAKPLRWYAIPNLMRYEKPQKGRLREFWQYNADIFGGEAAGDVEIIQLAVEMLKGFGANESHFEILINDRRFVDLVFEQMIGLSAEATKKLYKLVDRKNKMNQEKFTAEVDSITGDPEKTATFEKYLNLQSIQDLQTLTQNCNQATLDLQVNPLVRFLSSLHELGFSEYIKFDPTIVRGLDYYTGIVFEIFDKHPENRRALAGGGSYANLLQIFNEQPLPGMGFGLGEVTLTDFLTTHQLLPDFSKPPIDLLIGYLNQEAENRCFSLATQLRRCAIKTELFLGEAKPKKLFSHADKKEHRFLLMIGADELTSNEAQLKNLKTKDVHKVDLNNAEDMAKIIQGLR